MTRASAAVLGFALSAIVMLGCGGPERRSPGQRQTSGLSDEQRVRTLASDYFHAVDGGDTKRFCALLARSTLKKIAATAGDNGIEGCGKAVTASQLSQSAKELGTPRVGAVTIAGDHARLDLRTEQGGAAVAQVMTAARERDGWKVEEISAAEAPAGDKFAYRVPSESMKPAFDVGDVVFVDPRPYKRTAPRYGDIVIFNAPPNAEAGQCAVRATPGAPCARSETGVSRLKLIKRIVGLPGDKIAIRRGRVVRNGSADTFDIKPCRGAGSGCNLPRAVRVPPKQYYVVGDNRGASDDSRFWGPVSQRAILGRVDSK